MLNDARIYGILKCGDIRCFKPFYREWTRFSNYVIHLVASSPQRHLLGEENPGYYTAENHSCTIFIHTEMAVMITCILYSND